MKVKRLPRARIRPPFAYGPFPSRIHLLKSDAACDFFLNAAPIVLHMFLHSISRPSAARGLRRVGVTGLDAGCSLSSDACGPSAGWPWSTIRLPPVHTYTKTSGQPAVLTTEKEKGNERKRQARLKIKFEKMATPEGIEPPTHCLEGSCSIL